MYQKHILKRFLKQFFKNLQQEDISFLLELPYTITLPDLKWTLVHAGLQPEKPLSDQEPDHMVRMRNIAEDGTPTYLRDVGTAWVDKWAEAGRSRVIFGHDAMRRLQQGPNYLGLDTGLVYGNKLTALIREPNGHERLVTVDAKKPYEKVKGPIIKR